VLLLSVFWRVRLGCFGGAHPMQLINRGMMTLHPPARPDQKVRPSPP
jgi:hypothetical protein